MPQLKKNKYNHHNADNTAYSQAQDAPKSNHGALRCKEIRHGVRASG